MDVNKCIEANKLQIEISDINSQIISPCDDLSLELKRKLIINGESVKLLYFRASHLSMLYHLSNHDIGDAHLIVNDQGLEFMENLFGTKNWIIMEDVANVIFHEATNTEEAIDILLKRPLFQNIPDVYDVITHTVHNFERIHNHFIPMFYKKNSRCVNRSESDLIVTVMKELMKNDIFTLSFYHGLIVPKSKAEIAKNVFHKKYRKFMHDNFDCLLSWR